MQQPGERLCLATKRLLVLKCDVTNNGYKPAPVRVFTEVSNASWMSPYLQIRIDADLNPNDHDNNVILQNFDAGMTTSVWLNLSIPPAPTCSSRIGT